MQEKTSLSKHLVMGTAGHVDHGKTSLIKALTGIDTDRLKEEKERGITIELGFAFLDLENGERLGVIDVPGHEKFIRNMVAGASGIDFVLLVIAADEGVMPQTREHVSICSFLGIRKAIVALTKSDMVDPEWLGLVMADVSDYLDSTVFKGAPITPVSAITGDGLSALQGRINEAALQAKRVEDAGIFRLPIDRVFSIKGFGTVVTGTVISGDISLSQEVVILPQNISSKVRTLQTHGKTSEHSWRGQRTAINLLNVEKTAITRGSIIASANVLFPSRWLDIFLVCDASGKIKNKSIVRFHSATSEIMARITLFGVEELHAGESCYAQLYLQTAFPAIALDHFVLRSYSPVTTIGGGVIIDPKAKKLKRDSVSAQEELSLLHSGSLLERANIIVKRAEAYGIKIEELVVRLGAHKDEVKKALAQLAKANTVVYLSDNECLAMESLQAIQKTIIATLEGYHRQNPLKQGINKEELRMLVGAYLPLSSFTLALQRLEQKVVIDGNEVRLASYSVRLKDATGVFKNKLIKIYEEAGATPPSLKEIALQFTAQAKEFKDVVQLLIKEGTLVRIAEDMYFIASVVENIRKDYFHFLVANGKATPAEFRELTGLSRKYTIPLMEYFDSAKLTIRVGDARVLREKKT
ncbi:MAG: selenocysteine-specific translation elongation factor [Deltaproteobacteria bacterium]|nr:selenocysteine-specific translation elongation factor [Deltaproteobacteria bacterium]